MHVDRYLWLIPALPLAGFLVNGLFGNRFSRPMVGLVAVLGPVVAFVLSVLALVQVQQGHGEHVPHQVLWNWMSAGALSVDFGLRVDALTAVMLMNVTGIGSLIHVYSYGYMHEDPGFSRFMAYLNLFLCAMLLLVMGDNLLLLFVGWEGVGLCSYLLIGFWYDNLDYTDAGRKAFVVNRIGDFAFLIGAFTLFALTGTFSFTGMEEGVAELLTGPAMLAEGPLRGMGVHAALLFAGLCLFGGATGKSAQIPLYVWLPDAMAGPTPVSALIHAATMVTAGVYLIGRMDFLYVLLPEAGQVVAFVAAATALLSGLIAVGQYDIKKVLAYSTVSQLGFMFAGMATTLWHTGLFHVVTHAFFKALLFLGAGAVIHALHHEQDIRKMGGLWKDLRLVTVLFVIGSLALAGVPPFAGFFSKDEIVAAVWLAMDHEGGLWPAVFGMLVVSAILTAFYTTRLVMLAFFGPPADSHRHVHPLHWTMTSVLVVLAILSTGAGLVEFFGGHPFQHFVEASWVTGELAEAGLHHALTEEAERSAHLLAIGVSVLALVVGGGLGGFLYGPARKQTAAFVQGAGRLPHRILEDKFYVDELYDRLVVRPLGALAQLLFRFVDRWLIDWFAVEGAGNGVVQIASVLRRTQVGAVSVATAATLVGTVLVLLWMITHG
jgi:NADH-quinone oxidoreductase subunit L